MTKTKEQFKPEDYMNALAPVEEVQLPARVDPEAQYAEGLRSGVAPGAQHYSTRIATALAEIMGEIGGVGKHGKNTFHNYKYVRIEDILAKVTPLLASHGIVIIQSETGRALFDNDNVISVSYAFTIAHKSGDVWPDRPVHTGMSTARNSKGGFDDKSINKCHTAARKYFLKALFQITDEETPDPDNQEDQPRVKPQEDTAKKVEPETTKQTNRLIKLVMDSKSLADLDSLAKDKDFKTAYDALPLSERARIGKIGQNIRDQLSAAVTPIDDSVPV